MSEFEMNQNTTVTPNEVPETPAETNDIQNNGMTNLQKGILGGLGLLVGVKLGAAMNKIEESKNTGEPEKGSGRHMFGFKKKDATTETTDTNGEDAIAKFLDSLTDEQLDALKARIDIQKEINKRSAELEALKAKR